MNKGLKHDTMRQVSRIEQEKRPFPRQAVAANQWDSVESDTESLAQERAYQQQLQMHTKYILPQKENADVLQHEYADEDDQVYDSLEVAVHPHAKTIPTLNMNTQIYDRERTSQLLFDDAYSDLRYDPNWRTNLKGADRFNDSPQFSVGEYYQVPKEKPRQACVDRQALVIKEGYRYIIDTSPVAVGTPHMAGNESDRSYHLHRQNGQTSPGTSPRCHNHALQLRSPETELLRPSSIFTKDERDNTLQRRFREQRENSRDNAGENICGSLELTEDTHAMYLQGFKTYNQQELKRTRGGYTEPQQMSTSAWTIPKVLSNKKLERLTEDIVERNKITLGRNTSKCSSYVTAHALKQEMPHNWNKLHDTLKETASTESQEDSSDPKLWWLQKTQLRVTQISKGKKDQRKEYPNPPQQQQPLPPGVRAEWGDCLSSPLAGLAGVTQPHPQKTTSSQPLPPTIHLNISSRLLPLLQQKGQDAIINLASLHGCPQRSPTSEFELALSPGSQQTNPRKSSQMSWKGVHAQLHYRNLESCPEQWQRMNALKWPLSCEEEEQKWSPNEVRSKQFPQNLPKTPTTMSSLGSSSYSVLPPIGKPMTGKEPESSLGQCVNTAGPIHKSSSDGYLVQMEKQKQLRARVTYKAYSLKDYKQLKSNISLQGLGPDYTANEKTKMKRQRLYSNVIREQNKKISRIPFLPAKDPEGNDKKVPRVKALEYAKNIAKPPVQSQPNQRQNMSQPDTEVLRKRHEEEKQTVAQDSKKYMLSEARCNSRKQPMEPMLS